MSDKGDCRTAPATPGPLIRHDCYLDRFNGTKTDPAEMLIHNGFSPDYRAQTIGTCWLVGQARQQSGCSNTH